MGPLVYYCRWRGAKLRLRGRDAAFTWGELVTAGETGEQIEAFRFDLNTWELTLSDATGNRRLQLDELGVVVAEQPRPTTSSDAAP
jgi:hypothetical protein